MGLAYDKRSNGSHGLALLGDVALDGGVRLCVGDRLEPSKSLPDVNAFLDLAVFPKQVTFWRPAAETLSRHRNPLFQIVGVTPPRSLTVDWMHSLNLGVLLQFTKEALWFCIDNGVWGQDGTIDEIVEKATQLIRFDLRAWYKQRHRMFPSEGLTRANLTKKCLVTTQTAVVKPRPLRRMACVSSWWRSCALTKQGLGNMLSFWFLLGKSFST